MRGQWFIDGTWLPLEEDESDLIEVEHLARFRGQQMRDTYEMEVVTTTVDSKDGEMSANLLCIRVCRRVWVGELFCSKQSHTAWSGDVLQQTAAEAHLRRRSVCLVYQGTHTHSHTVLAL